jgi:chromosome segregation ATPase
MNETIPSPTPSASRGSFHIPVLFGLVIALIVANVALFVWLDNLKRETAQMRETLLAEVAKVRETHTLSSASSRQRLDELRAELEAARQQAASVAGQAKKDALKHAEEIARQLKEEQLRQQAQVSSQISEVKEAAVAANTKIADVASDVGSVRNEVAATKSELEKTIAELKSVRGDLGVQSGLIATNSKELAALKALGDRNYYEFNLTKTKTHQKVGNVMVKLTKTDVKKNKYTIELIADDKKVEKKDKNVNEPVQFYVAGARQPYELVVNEVRKDQIVGYLATPKVAAARN